MDRDQQSPHPLRSLSRHALSPQPEDAEGVLEWAVTSKAFTSLDPILDMLSPLSPETPKAYLIVVSPSLHRSHVPTTPVRIQVPCPFPLEKNGT